MENTLTYHDPLRKAARPKTEDSTWDRVLAAHKEKNYKGVILGLLDYIDLELAARTGTADRSHFEIPHGSIILNLNITDEDFEVEAPFLNIAGSKRIPILRKVTELNFSPLNLTMIQLDGDQLVFRYKCPLSLCEPYRTYDALREICLYADSYDDEFISKFDANWIREPIIQPYSDEDKQNAWEHMQQYIAEAAEGVNYFETKRSFNLAWDVIVTTLMKLEYHIQPQGMLRTRLEKMVSYMTGSENPMNEKVNRGKKYLMELAKYPQEEFFKDLYISSTFIPYKVRSNVQNIRSNSETAFAQSKKEIDLSNHLGATMTLTYHFLYMFYHNSVPDEVESTVREALKASSGQKWEDASGILFDAMQHIMTYDNKVKEEEEAVKPKKKKGKRFFDKLFGG